MSAVVGVTPSEEAVLAEHPATGVLSLPLDARRELTLRLLWSLPREDVIDLHTNLTRLLQRDIIGSLPPELSLLVLANLDLDDILRCGLVSKTWRALCTEQKLWATLCSSSSPPIVPRRTTWQDLDVHQQLLHLSRLPPDAAFPYTSDEGGYDSSFDDLSLETMGSAHMDVLASQSGLGGGRGVNPLDVVGGVRGAVWERTGSGLPTHLHASSVREYRRSPRRRRPQVTSTPLAVPIPAEDDVALSSALAVPSPIPQPNHRHLYIVHDILNRRMRGGMTTSTSQISSPGPSRALTHKSGSGNIIPRVFDAISSIQAGGLPGHSETIYCLKIIARSMQISMTKTCADCLTNSAFPTFDALLSSSSVNNRSCGDAGSVLVTSRDWLLSGSRDLSLRLWQLASPAPKVVKVFHGGHTGSVLSLDVVNIPMQQGDRSKYVPHGSPSRRAGLSYKEVTTRAMAVSGGSDGKLCLWDLEHGDGSPTKVVEAHEDSVYCVRADNERVVSCSKDRTIRVFDVETLEEILVIATDQEQTSLATLSGHSGAVNAVALSKDYIITVSGDKSIRVRCMRTGTLLAGVVSNTRGIASLDFEPPSFNAQRAPQHPGASFRGTIVIGTSDASIKTFHLVSHSHANLSIVDALDLVPPMRNMTFQEMLDDADDVSMIPEEEKLDAPELRIESAGQCWASCICAPGLAQPEGKACQKCLNRGHTDLVRSLVLGEKTILSGSYDSTVKVWDRFSGQLLLDLPTSHGGRVFAVAGDKTRIVSSGLDSRLTIWDFSRGLDTAFVMP